MASTVAASTTVRPLTEASSFERGVDPGRGQSECRLGGMRAGQRHLIAGRIHHHVLAVPDLAGAGLDLLDLDDVGVGVELHIVEDAHRGHDEAHFDRQRSAQRLDLLGQAVGAVGCVDQRQQRIAEFDLEIVHLERGGDRLLGRGGLGGIGLFRLSGDRLLGAAVDQISQRRRAAAEREERHHRNAGQQRHDQHDGPRHAERLGITGELAKQRLVGGAGDARLGNQEAGGGRDD